MFRKREDELASLSEVNRMNEKLSRSDMIWANAGYPLIHLHTLCDVNDGQFAMACLGGVAS